jgi:hypothetical protein
MIKRLLLNWRTTSIGAGMIISAGTHLAFAVHSGDADASTWKNDLLLMCGGMAAVVAGDAAVSAKATQQVTDAVLTGDTSTLKKTPTVNPPTSQ